MSHFANYSVAIFQHKGYCSMCVIPNVQREYWQLLVNDGEDFSLQFPEPHPPLGFLETWQNVKFFTTTADILAVHRMVGTGDSGQNKSGDCFGGNLIEDVIAPSFAAHQALLQEYEQVEIN